MGKPTKGNKNKRPPSDTARLNKSHLNHLKRNKAVVSSSFNVPDSFKVTKVSNSLIRISGPGAQAIKLASKKDQEEVIRAVKERNWTRVVNLIPRKESIIDYKNDEVKDNK